MSADGDLARVGPAEGDDRAADGVSDRIAPGAFLEGGDGAAGDEPQFHQALPLGAGCGEGGDNGGGAHGKAVQRMEILHQRHSPFKSEAELRAKVLLILFFQEKNVCLSSICPVYAPGVRQLMIPSAIPRASFAW